MVHQSLKQARRTLFLDNQPEEAIALLTPLLQQRSELPFDEDRAFMELLGMAHQKLSRFQEAAGFFQAIQDYYQAGYSMMLKGDLPKTYENWLKMFSIRNNHWCITLYGLVSNRLTSVPTFLQIRNHLEADIVHLCRAGQTAMAMNILNYIEMMASINYEAYKFAGRGLLHAGNLELASRLLLKAQKTLPNDPEVYYHMGQYYNRIGQDKDALLMLHQCVLISPTYTPASDLAKTIQQAFLPLYYSSSSGKSSSE